ncbi:MAG: Gfo/Idh/MocA family oxidoreductase [Ignavibacteriaceae bacterium]
MNIGIVGLGYWGPNLVRNFLANSNINKVIGCDRELERLNFIKSRFPEIELCNDYTSLLKMDIDAVAIATPVFTHYHLAKKALEAGKHIWVEKPFTATSTQAQELIELADKKNLKIFVDHTFIYTGAVQKIKELVDQGELGDIIYFDSVRINLGLFQHDVNVIWDLVPHDLSIMDHILSSKDIVGVTANGVANYYKQENIAHLSMHFKNNSCFAHFHVNWTSPVKIRRMIVGGTKKMLVFDDMENFEKIKVYDCRIEMLTPEKIHSALVQYRIGDMYSPKVKQTEALAEGVKEFVNSIIEDRQPLTSAKEGLQVVRILEAADQSLKNRGQIVDIYADNKVPQSNNAISSNAHLEKAVGF